MKLNKDEIYLREIEYKMRTIENKYEKYGGIIFYSCNYKMIVEGKSGIMSVFTFSYEMYDELHTFLVNELNKLIPVINMEKINNTCNIAGTNDTNNKKVNGFEKINILSNEIKNHIKNNGIKINITYLSTISSKLLKDNDGNIDNAIIYIKNNTEIINNLYLTIIEEKSQKKKDEKEKKIDDIEVLTSILEEELTNTKKNTNKKILPIIEVIFFKNSTDI